MPTEKYKAWANQLPIIKHISNIKRCCIADLTCCTGNYQPQLQPYKVTISVLSIKTNKSLWPILFKYSNQIKKFSSICTDWVYHVLKLNLRIARKKRILPLSSEKLSTQTKQNRYWSQNFMDQHQPRFRTFQYSCFKRFNHTYHIGALDDLFNKLLQARKITNKWLTIYHLKKYPIALNSRMLIQYKTSKRTA